MIHATARQCGHRCQPLVIGAVAFITEHFTRFMCRSRYEAITKVCRPSRSEVALIDELSSLRHCRAQNVFRALVGGRDTFFAFHLHVVRQNRTPAPATKRNSLLQNAMLCTSPLASIAAG